MDRQRARVAIKGALKTTNNAMLHTETCRLLWGCSHFGEEAYDVYFSEGTTVFCPKCQSVGRIIGTCWLETKAQQHPCFSSFHHGNDFFNPRIIVDGNVIACGCPPHTHFVTLSMMHTPYLAIGGRRPLYEGALAKQLYGENEPEKSWYETAADWASDSLHEIAAAITQPHEGVKGAAKAAYNTLPETAEFVINHAKQIGLPTLSRSAGLHRALGNTDIAERLEQSMEVIKNAPDDVNLDAIKLSIDNKAQQGGKNLFDVATVFMPVKAATNVGKIRRAAKGTAVSDMAYRIRFSDTLTEGDRLFGRASGNIIAESSVARNTYARILEQGTEVRYFNDPTRDYLGVFNRNSNLIRVNLAYNSSPQQIASTLVHEGAHQTRSFRGIAMGTKYEEYFAFRREFLFNEGRRPTLVERYNIWNQTSDIYEHLPDGKVPVRSWRK